MFGRLFKILFLLILFLIGMAKVEAQPEITFSSKSHDFGKVSEGEIAAVEFIFTNTGDQPLVLGEIKASCGCTTPFWTKDPVMPGRTGKVKASYNSKNRPGAFNKSITVNSNATSRTTTLFIKGTVERAPVAAKTYTAAEKAVSPKLVIENTTTYQLGKVEKNKAAPIRILVTNKGKSPLEISGVESTCHCVDLLASELPTIQPGRSAPITLIYEPRSVGKTAVNASLISNDITQSKQQVEILSEVIAHVDSPVLLQENRSKITF
ncbi:MAG: DUF1573 domain-containing protein [Cyclobacteriaceae bacterium]